MNQTSVAFTAVLVVSVLAGLIAGCSATEDPIQLYNRGVERYNEGRYVQALGLFKWSLEQKREFSAPMIGLSRCYLALAREDEGREDHTAAFADLEESIYWINQAIKADPGNTDAFRTKIVVLTERGEVESAIATARWAAREVGPSASTLIMLAETYHELGDYDNAELALRQGVKVSPDNITLLMALARLYDQIGQVNSALTYYQRAYEIDPYYPGLLMRISELKVMISQQSPTTQKSPADESAPSAD